MKVFIIDDANGVARAFALDEGTAMDILFDRAIEAGRVDMDARTFDAAGERIGSDDSEQVLACGLMTDEQFETLKQEGLLLL